jgi:cystathionine beta-lyase
VTGDDRPLAHATVPMIIVLMGVSGSGKSTVGAALAAALGWPLIDADDLHSQQNVAKMAAGTPLTDDDRWPWLDRIVDELRRVTAGGGSAVLACSALKRSYRDRLARAGDLRFVHLRGDPATIAQRLAARHHRYMPATLLGSQYATLEAPDDAIDIDIAASVEAQVRTIIDALGVRAARPDDRGARDRSRYRLATQVAHLGRDPRRFLGTVNTPVFRASTILLRNVAELEQATRGEFPGVSYGLHGMPTVTDLQQALAALEGGHAALVVPSGLTATTFPLLALAKPGDHVLVTDAVYGPTRRFCDNHMRRLGIDVGYYDPLAGAEIAREFRPNTRLVFTESPGSLTFEVQDLPAIAAVAHARGARVILDNTWATPLGFRSFEHGADVSVHAATKYIGGHSDVLIGAVIANADTFGALHRLWTDMGITPSSDDCFLALRGLRTLAVRLARHAASAMEVATWLAKRPEVREVLYPALPGDRGHALWTRDFRCASGLFGVVLEPADGASVARMLDGMRLFGLGWSWGGFESLMIPTWPARARTVTTWNPGGPALRLQIGLEDPADLIEDLDDGFRRLRGP